MYKIELRKALMPNIHDPQEIVKKAVLLVKEVEMPIPPVKGMEVFHDGKHEEITHVGYSCDFKFIYASALDRGYKEDMKHGHCALTLEERKEREVEYGWEVSK